MWQHLDIWSKLSILDIFEPNFLYFTHPYDLKTCTRPLTLYTSAVNRYGVLETLNSCTLYNTLQTNQLKRFQNSNCICNVYIDYLSLNSVVIYIWDYNNLIFNNIYIYIIPALVSCLCHDFHYKIIYLIENIKLENWFCTTS